MADQFAGPAQPDFGPRRLGSFGGCLGQRFDGAGTGIERDQNFGHWLLRECSGNAIWDGWLVLIIGILLNLLFREIEWSLDLPPWIKSRFSWRLWKPAALPPLPASWGGR